MCVQYTCYTVPATFASFVRFHILNEFKELDVRIWQCMHSTLAIYNRRHQWPDLSFIHFCILYEFKNLNVRNRQCMQNMPAIWCHRQQVPLPGSIFVQFIILYKFKDLEGRIRQRLCRTPAIWCHRQQRHSRDFIKKEVPVSIFSLFGELLRN